MSYRIFVVEDDSGIAQGIKDALAPWDLEAINASNFKDVVAQFKQVKPHLVLMDISLPFKDGYFYCSEIRKLSSVPIIFISSASDNMNIVMAMNMGADDFIPKPFDKSVLIAKIQAVLRRSYDYASFSPVIEHNGVSLNTNDNSLTYNGQNINLSKNEYKILLTLMQNKGKVISRESLMEALWETDSFVDENTLTVNIGRLRKKLQTVGIVDFITTKFGVGYIVQ